MPQYRLKLIDSFGRVIAKRKYLFQSLGRLAAMSIPTSELLRLRDECKGNFELVLNPIRQALMENGYKDLVILPAQTHIVELVPMEQEVTAHEHGIDADRVALVTAYQMFNSAFEQEVKPSPKLLMAYQMLRREMSKMELDTWVPSVSSPRG